MRLDGVAPSREWSRISIVCVCERERDKGGEGTHRLHLDGVALLERVVEDARRVDHLPTQVFVVRVPCT